jgi:hypothetical protein
MTTLSSVRAFTSTNGSTWSDAGTGAGSTKLIAGTTGNFLAHSGSGNAQFSSDTGSTWTSGSVNFTGGSVTVSDIAFGGGVYVAVGRIFTGVQNQPRISTSTNGTTWTQRYSPASVGLFGSVTYTNLGSGFFIAGGSGVIFYSDTTGVTWTQATITGGTPSPTEIIDGGASASPRFVGLTNSTAVVTSNDGVNWTVETLGTPVSAGQAAFTNGKWVLNNAYYILTSG